MAVAGDHEQMVADLYVAEKTPFSILLYPGDNVYTQYGIQGGNIPAEAAGHYVEISHLAPGDHVIELGGKTCQNKHTVLFETSATYNIHIEE